MVALRSIGCALAASALVVGCGGEGAGETAADEPQHPPPRACTKIGCADGVTLRVRDVPPAASTARACVEGRCTKWRLREGRLTRVPVAGAGAVDAVRVSVSVHDAGGVRLTSARTRAHLTPSRPNGPDCPPVCYSARVVFYADRGRLKQVA